MHSRDVVGNFYLTLRAAFLPALPLALAVRLAFCPRRALPLPGPLARPPNANLQAAARNGAARLVELLADRDWFRGLGRVGRVGLNGAINGRGI